MNGWLFVYLNIHISLLNQFTRLDILISPEFTESVCCIMSHLMNNFYSYVQQGFSLKCKKGKVSYPCDRPWKPTELRDVEAPTFSRQSAQRWRWGCQPYAPAVLYPQADSWYSFLLWAESTPGPQCGWKVRSIEKSNIPIGNRTRDLPTCSIVPQPITLPCAHPSLTKLILLLLLLLLLLLTANWFPPGGSGTTIQQTNNTLTTIRQHTI
jgi:hypothetical protein